MTREEAVNCLNALENAHLYGRRLVIDWAEETEYDEVDNDDHEDVNMKNNRKEDEVIKSSFYNLNKFCYSFISKIDHIQISENIFSSKNRAKIVQSFLTSLRLSAAA